MKSNQIQIMHHNSSYWNVLNSIQEILLCNALYCWIDGLCLWKRFVENIQGKFRKLLLSYQIIPEGPRVISNITLSVPQASLEENCQKTQLELIVDKHLFLTPLKCTFCCFYDFHFFVHSHFQIQSTNVCALKLFLKLVKSQIHSNWTNNN